jgi:hypothetical protein
LLGELRAAWEMETVSGQDTGQVAYGTQSLAGELEGQGAVPLTRTENACTHAESSLRQISDVAEQRPDWPSESLLVHTSSVSYANNKHNNTLLFYRTDYSIITDPVFPEAFEVFSEGISKAARVILGGYFFP